MARKTPVAIWNGARAKMPLKLQGYVADGVAPQYRLIENTLTITFTNPTPAERFLHDEWEGKPVPDVVAQYFSDEAGLPLVAAVNPFCLNGVRVLDVVDSQPGVPTHPLVEEEDDTPSNTSSESGVSGVLGKLMSLFKKN